MSCIRTSYGEIHFPTFMPVTTFGDKYPMDRLVQPYLRRMSQCIMVSYYYARKMKERPTMPMFIDSGGFASLFQDSEIVECDGYGEIQTKAGETITPADVLAFQEQHADLGATLDFIITPGMDMAEAERRQKLTIQNALYAKNLLSGDMILYASLQCWDAESAMRCAAVYADAGFRGIAIGGMVPRAKDPEYIKTIVAAVRKAAPNCVIHVFGCGQANLLPELVAAGADSFDSSSYVRDIVDAAKGSAAYAGIYLSIAKLHALNCAVSGQTSDLNEWMPNADLLKNC